METKQLTTLQQMGQRENGEHLWWEKFTLVNGGVYMIIET